MNLKETLEQELTALRNEYTALTISIPRDESFAQQIQRHNLAGRTAGIQSVVGLMDNSDFKTYDEGYEQGVADTLSELQEVYGEGIEDTDLWNEHMTGDDN